MGPPQFQSRHSENHLHDSNPDTCNGCQDEDVRFDIGNGNQDNDANFDIGLRNQSMDVSFDIGNGNQDDHARIDISNSNPGRDANLNVRHGIQNGWDAIDGVDAEVLEIAQAFQSLGTEGILESVCIYTALYPIHVNCFLDISCIPQYIP